MNVEDIIVNVTEKQMNTKAKKIYPVGKGASGSVYCVEITDEPFKIAVKMSNHYDAVCKEKKMLDFLYDRVSYETPKPYFIWQENDTVLLGMGFIRGMSGKSKKIRLIPNKKHLANDILEAFMNTQSFKNEKFGKFDNPVFDTWQEYYFDFFEKIYCFTKEKFKADEVDRIVMEAIELIKQNFSEVFNDTQQQACLCHGDFWMPNLIIDFWKSELVGAVDPFDMLWSEPEYELFSLTMGYGKNLKLYELYKSKNPTSKYCDLKVELYALCNELHWYMILDSVGHGYLKFRSKRLIEQMKLFGLIKLSKSVE